MSNTNSKVSEGQVFLFLFIVLTFIGLFGGVLGVLAGWAIWVLITISENIAELTRAIKALGDKKV